MSIPKTLIVFILLKMCCSFNAIKNANKLGIYSIVFGILLLGVALEVNAQTNFNYVGNGDYKEHGCTVAQLSSMQTCIKPISNFIKRIECLFSINYGIYLNF